LAVQVFIHLVANFSFFLQTIKLGQCMRWPIYLFFS